MKKYYAIGAAVILIVLVVLFALTPKGDENGDAPQAEQPSSFGGLGK